MNLCDSVHKEITMSHWNIAAAQYQPTHHYVMTTLHIICVLSPPPHASSAIYCSSRNSR